MRSGALITARHALELGRPVLVAPGRIGDWSTAGSLGLLHDTPARPLVGLDAMLEDLGFFRPPSGSSTAATSVGREPALRMLGPSERAVAERLCRGAAGLDSLVADTGLPPSVVSSTVTLLLMRGWAQSVGPAYLVAGPLLSGIPSPVSEHSDRRRGTPLRGGRLRRTAPSLAGRLYQELLRAPPFG